MKTHLLKEGGCAEMDKYKGLELPYAILIKKSFKRKRQRKQESMTCPRCRLKNHLHFQAYYLSVPFPVEKALTRRIPIAKGLEKNSVKISKLVNYPVRGLVYEGGDNLQDLADVVATSCFWLQDNNVPFNILISDSGRRIFIFPQCYAEKQALGEVAQELLDTQVNPAVWEISGHMVLKRKEDYNNASEDYAWRLLAEVSLSDERFEEVKAYIFEAACLVESKEDEAEANENEGATTYQQSQPIPAAQIPVDV